ncbi:MAG: ACT domain-containing protein [Acidimicrobiales bacterium]
MAVRDLDELLGQLSVSRRPGRFCMVSGVTVPSGMAVSATIAEDEGTTSVLSVTDAESLGARPEFVAAWLTVQVHSALDAVGLTAALAGALAAENIACNVLAGYNHDHLLVPVEKADRAIAVLEALRDSHRR